ncbi:MAG: hypothetical protein ABW223_06705 [Rariglobus sp.]
MLAIEVAKSAQPPIALPEGDSDAPDEDAGDPLQERMSSVEVAALAAAGATTGATGAPSFDDDGPIWPDETSESAMRVEVSERGETLSSKAAREAAEAAAEAAAEKKNLPPLDDLIAKIPADVLDTLEDLFRVKFVKVARTPKNVFKT